MDVYARIVKAKLFIDDHYASPLDLDKLSEEACFSKFHFLRVFKKTYHKTPHQYLTERRLEKAKEKLSRHGKVSDVCAAVGFESATSFSQKFKEYTGEPPAVFRLRTIQTLWLSKQAPERFIPSCFSIKFSPED